MRNKIILQDNGITIFGKMVKIRIFSFILIVIIALIVYSNTFHSDFHFDDQRIVLENPLVRNIQQFTNLNTWLDINTRPLTIFTFALNYKIHQDSVFGYHLVNLIVHIIAGIFVFLFVEWIIFILYGNDKSYFKKNGLLSLFAALIFISHPIQTQAVTYIVQRMTSLSGMFYLISIYVYARGRYYHINNGKLSGVIGLYALSILFGMSALLSKQSAVTFPAAMILYEFFFIRDNEEKLFKRYLSVSSITIALIFLIIVVSGNLPSETDKISRCDYLLTQFRVIVNYIQLLLLPINQNIDHDINISHSLLDFKVLGCISLILIIIIGGIFLYKRNRYISFGIFWFFLPLTIESSIIPIRDVMFEHRLYLSLMGLAIIITGFAYNIFLQKKISYSIVLLSAIILMLGIITYNRNKVWITSNELLVDVISKSPNKARPLVNYGTSLFKRGKLKEALIYYNRALLNSTQDKELYIDALYNTGIVYCSMGDFEKGKDIFNSVLKIDPDNYRSLNGLGQIAEIKGDIDIEKGLRYYERSIKIKPENNEALYKIGKLYSQKGSFDMAITYYMKEVEKNPDNATAINNLGILYLRKGDLANAKKYVMKALDIMPNNKDFLYNMRVITEAMKR
jgi:protein O-mannosyl-transferase